MGPMARPEDAGPFDVVLADCPWTYADKGAAGARGAAFQYPLLKLPDLCALDVPRICAPHAICAMWATGPLMREALAVMAAWGFEYKTMLFVWRKVYPKGTPMTGMGRHTRSCYEYVLMGARGKGISRVDAGIAQEVETLEAECVQCQLGPHSAKPYEVARRIQRLYGPQRRVELFAREKVDGWHGIGLDLPGDGRDIRAVLGSREPNKARPPNQALPVPGAYAPA